MHFCTLLSSVGKQKSEPEREMLFPYGEIENKGASLQAGACFPLWSAYVYNQGPCNLFCHL